MKVFVILGIVLAALPANAVAAEPVPDHMPGQLLVRFEPGVSGSERASVRREQHAPLKDALPLPGLQLVSLPPGTSVARAERQFEADPAVTYASPNHVFDIGDIPDDRYFSSLWGLDNTAQHLTTDFPERYYPYRFRVRPSVADSDIDAPEAWNKTTGNANVIVAVADTGMATPYVNSAGVTKQLTHPDLEPNVWKNPGEVGGGRETNHIDDDHNGEVDDWRGYSFIDETLPENVGTPRNLPVDYRSHGTHVAGTIAARGDNGIGVAGVSWYSKVMATKVCTNTGCPEAGLIEAIDYADRNGARIMNMSLGTESTSYFTSALSAAMAAHPDLLFVTIAHNNSQDLEQMPNYPCSFPLANIICVAASEPSDDFPEEFSSYGAVSVDLVAPGFDILSTKPSATDPNGSYGYDIGTSMSAPHVSGAAALLLSADPYLTPVQLKNALMASVDVRPQFAGKVVTNGRLNVNRALDLLPKATAAVQGGVATYVDESNRPNDLKVEKQGSSYAITDSSIGIAPGSGCVAGGDIHTVKCSGAGSVKVQLGPGNDKATVTAAIKSELIGGPGIDTLAGGDKDDVLRGGDGNDVIIGYAGNDEIFGDAGGDAIVGGAGNDTYDGAAGNDLMIDGWASVPEGGKDVVDGGPGADAVVTGKGADTVKLRDRWTDTVIDCGADKDTAELDTAPYDDQVTGCENVTRAVGSIAWSDWENLAGPADPVNGDPSAVSWAPNRVDLFTRTEGIQATHSFNSINWSDWDSPAPGPIQSGPDATSQASGKLDVFAVGTYGQLVQTAWNGSAWSGWQQDGTGPLLNSGPSAISWANGRLDVFARGASNNDIQHRYFTDGQWQPWESLGGFITFDPDATSMRSGHLALFARGNQNKVFWKQCSQSPCDAASWTAWSEVPGQGTTEVSSPVSAVSTEDGKMDLFARGPAPDYNLLRKSYANGSWSGSWENLGGSLDSGPDAASWGPNRIDVFAKGSGNQILHRWLG